MGPPTDSLRRRADIYVFTLTVYVRHRGPNSSAADWVDHRDGGPVQRSQELHACRYSVGMFCRRILNNRKLGF